MVAASDCPGTISNGTYDLVGAGIREKQIGPAKVLGYAVGLYLDRKCVANWAAKSFSLSSQKTIVDDLLSSTLVHKGLHMHIARDLPMSRVNTAFHAALSSRVPSSMTDKIEELISYLCPEKKGLKKHTIIEIFWEGDILHVFVNSMRTGTITDGVFARAMFNVYLDSNTISPTLRKDVEKKVWNFVESGEAGKPVEISIPGSPQVKNGVTRKSSFMTFPLRLRRKQSTMSVTSNSDVESTNFSDSPPLPSPLLSSSSPQSPARKHSFTNSPIQAGVKLFNKAVPRFARLKSFDIGPPSSAEGHRRSQSFNVS